MKLRHEQGEWDEQPCYDGCPALIGFALRLLRDALLCLVLGHDFGPCEVDDPEAPDWHRDWVANTRRCMRCDRSWCRVGWKGLGVRDGRVDP